MSIFSWKLLHYLNHYNVYMSNSSISYINVIISCSQSHEKMFIYLMMYSFKRKNSDVTRESMTSQQLVNMCVSLCMCVCSWSGGRDVCLCVCVCVLWERGMCVCVWHSKHNCNNNRTSQSSFSRNHWQFLYKRRTWSFK